MKEMVVPEVLSVLEDFWDYSITGGNDMNPIFKTFTTLKGYYVFDRGRNTILSISKQEYELLNQRDENTIRHFREHGFLEDHQIQSVKHPNSDQLEYYLANHLEKITIQLTQNCNLRCAYCPYTGGYENRSYSDKTISFETIKKGIDYLLSHSQYTEQVTVGFYGGEPLLEMDLLKKSVAYTKSVSAGRKIYFTLTTNGTLLRDENVEYFIENDIHVIISIDGAKEFHNANRVFENGTGSFDIIMKNLSRIKQKYPEFFSLLTVNSVISTNNDLACSNEFFNAEDVLEQISVDMNTVSEFNAKNAVEYDEKFKVVNDFEICKAYLNMLGKLSDRAVSKLYQMQSGKVNITYKTLRPFRLEGKEMHPGGQCIPGVSRLLMDVDGNFYPCERVSEKSQIMRIGNVNEGIDVEKSRYLLNIGKITEKECINCFASNLCRICISWIDGNTELSREKKLEHCKKMKKDAIEEIRIITILKELGYQFKGAEY